jgi:hypothetical protein
MDKQVELTARHTYKAQNHDELSFKKHDVLVLVSKLSNKGTLLPSSLPTPFYVSSRFPPQDGGSARTRT